MRTAHSANGSGTQAKPAPGVNPPEVAEPYFMLPTDHFSLHYHLRFNPPPQGPLCNCGTWQIWCVPPHLGGCGHLYVQDELYCGRTVDEDQPASAKAAPCPGVYMRRPIRSAALMMGLCPSCRSDRVVIQVRRSSPSAWDAAAETQGPRRITILLRLFLCRGGLRG